MPKIPEDTATLIRAACAATAAALASLEAHVGGVPAGFSPHDRNASEPKKAVHHLSEASRQARYASACARAANKS